MSLVFLIRVPSEYFPSLLLDNQAAGSTPTKATAAAMRPKGSVIDLTEDDDDVQGKSWRTALFLLIVYFALCFRSWSHTMFYKHFKSDCFVVDFPSVTGVKKATVATPSSAQRAQPSISISNSKTTIYCKGEKRRFGDLFCFLNPVVSVVKIIYN